MLFELLGTPSYVLHSVYRDSQLQLYNNMILLCCHDIVPHHDVDNYNDFVYLMNLFMYLKLL